MLIPNRFILVSLVSRILQNNQETDGFSHNEDQTSRLPVSKVPDLFLIVVLFSGFLPNTILLLVAGTQDLANLWTTPEQFS